MITPVNGHLLIEPLVNNTFMSTQNETFQEIGIVVDFDPALEQPRVALTSNGEGIEVIQSIRVGDKVYFDSWLAAKFPKNESESYWLVKWEDVRAIEHE